MLGSFRRISRATKHEISVEDLQSESWIMADAIGKRRGFDIDFSNPDDASLIIRAINVEHVKKGDWRIRNSVRLDYDNSGDENAISWSNLIPARKSSGCGIRAKALLFLN